jgi:predicted nucleotidyltransferase
MVDEVVLTGSVSRGVADEVSDIEMLVVTRDQLSLEECETLARRAGLEQLDSWGAPDPVVRRVSGLREGVSLELVWWPRAEAGRLVDELLSGRRSSAGDALVHGVPLRTGGLLEEWQERLGRYPPELAAARIEEAALPWGGFSPRGLLTLIRPGDRLALAEWLVDGAARVLSITYALNRCWEPSSKRLATRVATLDVAPDRLAERIAESLTEADPRRALLVMTELQLESVRLAPSGPNVDRARSWLAAGAEILRG